MKNHFHLVLETPNANLVDGMRWLLSAYTIRLNRRQELFSDVHKWVRNGKPACDAGILQFGP